MQDPFSTRMYVRQGIVGFTSLLIVALLGFVVYWYLTYEPPVFLQAPEELNYGLVQAPVSSFTRSGYWYFYGTPKAGVAHNMQTDTATYLFDITRERLLVEPVTPVATTTGSIFGVIYDRDETLAGTADEIHPALIEFASGAVYRLNTPSGTLETNLTSDPFAKSATLPPRVAYSVYTGPVDHATAQNDLENWMVVAYDPVTGALIEIASAVSPVWFNEGKDLAVVQPGGIYRYNFAGDYLAPMVDNWMELTPNTEIAIPHTSQSIVMTIPSINALAVYQITNLSEGLVREEGIIAEADSIYRNPVFSPDGMQYATIRHSASSWDDVRGQYTDAQIVVRETRSRQPVEVFNVPFEVTSGISLLDWRAEPMMFTQSPLVAVQ